MGCLGWGRERDALSLGVSCATASDLPHTIYGVSIVFKTLPVVYRDKIAAAIKTVAACSTGAGHGLKAPCVRHFAAAIKQWRAVQAVFRGLGAQALPQVFLQYGPMCSGSDVCRLQLR